MFSPAFALSRICWSCWKNDANLCEGTTLSYNRVWKTPAKEIHNQRRSIEDLWGDTKLQTWLCIAVGCFSKVMGLDSKMPGRVPRPQTPRILRWLDSPHHPQPHASMADGYPRGNFSRPRTPTLIYIGSVSRTSENRRKEVSTDQSFEAQHQGSKCKRKTTIYNDYWEQGNFINVLQTGQFGSRFRSTSCKPHRLRAFYKRRWIFWLNIYGQKHKFPGLLRLQPRYHTMEPTQGKYRVHERPKPELQGEIRKGGCPSKVNGASRQSSPLILFKKLRPFEKNQQQISV